MACFVDLQLIKGLDDYVTACALKLKFKTSLQPVLPVRQLRTYQNKAIK